MGPSIANGHWRARLNKASSEAGLPRDINAQGLPPLRRARLAVPATPPFRWLMFAGSPHGRRPALALRMPDRAPDRNRVYFVYTKMTLEWDERKAALNAAKHGVTFLDATTVFSDPWALDGPDLRHSTSEPRFLRLGRAAGRQTLVVAYTMRGGDDGQAIRIISARWASRRERQAYEGRD